jgi:hypothetical protein
MDNQADVKNYAIELIEEINEINKGIKRDDLW